MSCVGALSDDRDALKPFTERRTAADATLRNQNESILILSPVDVGRSSLVYLNPSGQD